MNGEESLRQIESYKLILVAIGLIISFVMVFLLRDKK